MNNEQQSSDTLTNNVLQNDLNTTSIDTLNSSSVSQIEELIPNPQPIETLNQTETLIDTQTNFSNVETGPMIETIPDDAFIEQQSVNIQVQDPVTDKGLQEAMESQPQKIDETFKNINYFTPTSTDNFDEVPVPPVFEPEKDSKNKKIDKKTLIIILIIALIAIVGIGIFSFLRMAKTKAPTFSIITKELKLELGEELSKKIDDYATISGYDKNSCKLDTKNISASKVGAYKYFITCDNNKVEGTAIVDDTKAPNAVVNEVVVLPNASIKADDFIESCTDASTCTYEFKNEVTILSNLTSQGEYEIDIILSDEYNNESTIKAKLIVSLNAPVKYLTCKGQSIDVDDIYAVQTNTYRLGIDSFNMLYSTYKSSEFTFEELEDYNNFKKNYNEDEGINGIKGKANFNDNNKSITLKSVSSLDDINKELNVILANDINTIEMYLTMMGYSCK